MFNFNRNYTSISHRFRDIASYLPKVADSKVSHMWLAPRGEFRGNRWRQKTTANGLLCGTVSVALRIAILIEHKLVTDGRTDRQTNTGPQHIPHDQRARGKKSVQQFNKPHINSRF